MSKRGDAQLTPRRRVEMVLELELKAAPRPHKDAPPLDPLPR